MGRRASDISWRVAKSSIMLASNGFEKAQWTGFVPEVSARPTALLTDSAMVIVTRIGVVETVGRRGGQAQVVEMQAGLHFEVSRLLADTESCDISVT